MATAYDAGRALLPEAELAWVNTVAPYIPSDAVVVDVGAGTGRFADLFGAHFGAQVVAVEPAAGMRDQRRARGAPVWIGGRAEALPVRTSSCDVVWLCCVLHYLDLEDAGREIVRILRPDGRVLVRGVFPDGFDELLWMQWFPAARAIDEDRMPTVERVADAWRVAGLRLSERHRVPHRVADDLEDLAARLSHRAISTLELISDNEFEDGLAALRRDARRTPRAAVYSTVDTLVFRVDEERQ